MLFLLMFACLSNKTTLALRSPVYIKTFQQTASSEKGCYELLLFQDMVSKGLCTLEVKARSEGGVSLKTEYVCKSTSYQVKAEFKVLKDRVLCSVVE